MCRRLPGSYSARWELRNGGSAPRRNAGYLSSLLLVFFLCRGGGDRESVTLLIAGCLGNPQCGLETPQTGLYAEGEGLW